MCRRLVHTWPLQRCRGMGRMMQDPRMHIRIRTVC